MSIGVFNSNNISAHTTMALWLCFIITIALGIWGFVCPPKGIIDESILKYSTLLLGFVTAAITREAIKEGMGVKLRHGETELEIADNDE